MCTAYSMPRDPEIDSCTTYTSVSATGNGDANSTCYEKAEGIIIS